MSDGTPTKPARQGARLGRPRRNPVISQRIGNNIREAREEKGFTQKHLARLLDQLAEAEPGAYDSQTVSRWERGLNRPSDENLELLAEALDRPAMTWFFTVRPEEAAA